MTSTVAYLGLRSVRTQFQRACFSTSVISRAEKNISKAGDVGEISKSVDLPPPVEAEATSGAPIELQHRSVRIFQPTRNTMQSGGAKGERWRIDWDILQGAGRWENPLMGWASSADYMQGTRVSFKSKEDAMRFAEEQGWSYYIQEPSVKKIPPKNYAENYVYNANALRLLKTK